jgi:hypothetical protein
MAENGAKSLKPRGRAAAGWGAGFLQVSAPVIEFRLERRGDRPALAFGLERGNGPAWWRGRGEASIPVRPGPDQLEAFLALHLDQGGVDRGREARIVELDREVVAAALLRVLLPGGTELDCAREDPEVRALVRGVFDALEASLDVEGEGLDRAREAGLGQSSTVLLKRSISVCFAICWRTLPRCPLARSRRPDWSAAPLVGRFSATR